ncbi:hypothetical protein BH11ARM2_BH11ARM2_06980 [soil metagenome]
MIALDLLRAGAVTVAAAPVLLSLRKAPGKVRHAAFAAVLAASAAAPFAVGLVPPRVIQMAPALPVLGHAPRPEKLSEPFSSDPKPKTQISALEVRSPNPKSQNLPDWLLLLPALLPLSRMAFGWRTARRWAGNATPGPDGTLLSSSAPVPMTFFDGLHHRILLPTEAASWPSERLKAVLLHEQAHVRRGDWWVQTAARTVVALQWMNPLAWWMLRGLIDAAEESADQATLQGGMAPQIYARELLSLALPGLRPVGTLPMTPQTDLGRRVVTVLKGQRPVSRWAVGLAALAPLALVLPAASIGCATAIAKPMARQASDLRRVATEDQFGNADNGWVADLPTLRKAKLEYVVGWFKGTPIAWRPDGTSIPVQGLPIGPVKPTDEYVLDPKTKKYVKSGQPTPEERMFVLSFDDPSGIMDGGTQSATDTSGPARSTFGRGSWTTDPGKPGRRYTAGFIAFSNGYADVNGKTTFKGAVGFAVGPVDAKPIFTYDAAKGASLSMGKGASLGGDSAFQQEGFSFQSNQGGKGVDLIVKMTRIDSDFFKHPWLNAIATGKDGRIDSEGPILQYEGPKSVAHPYYRYSLPRPVKDYASIQVFAGATETTEFREVALIPKQAVQTAFQSSIDRDMQALRAKMATLEAVTVAKSKEPSSPKTEAEMQSLRAEIEVIRAQIEVRVAQAKRTP